LFFFAQNWKMVKGGGGGGGGGGWMGGAPTKGVSEKATSGEKVGGANMGFWFCGPKKKGREGCKL